MSLRRRMAVLAASSLLLAGCAVPGQGAAPGVAASYQGATVTTATLDDIVAAWSDASDGMVVPDRRAVATFAALGPAAVEAAEEIAEQAGDPLALNDALVSQVATNWFEGVGAVDPEPSDELLESMRSMLAIYLVVGSDPTLATIAAVSDEVAEGATFSPRLGEYSTEALLASVEESVMAAQAGGSYPAFLAVSGFGPTDAPWAARG